jgi:hypothetical protein
MPVFGRITERQGELIVKQSKKRLACLIFAGLAASTAFASENWSLQAVTLMNGDCQLQTAKDSSACKDAVMWTEFRNGRTMLSFYKNNLSFMVSGDTAAEPVNRQYRQPIDTMRFFDGAKLLREENGVKGECLFDLKANTLKCDVSNPRDTATYSFAFGHIHNIQRQDF